MVEYSAMTGVTQRATMREVRSLVERDDPQTDLLDKHGYEVAVPPGRKEHSTRSPNN